MAKYLVTGGCGFIGAHLVERLLGAGHEVIILDNLSNSAFREFSKEVKLIVGDVRDDRLVNYCMPQVDGCFHLAEINPAEQNSSVSDFKKEHSVNLIGFLNIVEASRKNCTPVVYSSSAAVYGDNVDSPLREESTTQPVSGYGSDKLSCEHHARIFSMQHKVPTVGLRFFNVYGPSVNPESAPKDAVSEFLYRINNGEDIYIFGDGEQTRDFVYIDDAVNFLMAGMKYSNMSPMVFNVCTGKGTTINQLLKMMILVSGKIFTIKHSAARQEDIFASIGDPQKAKKYISTETQFSLFSGLQAMINFHAFYDEKLYVAV